MGLTRMLGAAALRTTHVLCVELPGCWSTRVAVEREVARRGWHLALTPADADVLAICGSDGRPGARLPLGIDEVIARLWDQMPGPRVRVDLEGTAGAERALDQAAEALVDSAGQRADAYDRAQHPQGDTDETETHEGHGGHGGHDDGGHGGHDQGEHGGHDDDGHEHGGHDHGGMAPHGIPLAGGQQDRDGLEMDVLNVRLGPVLPHWPAGVVLTCTLAGDVVTHAELPPPPAEGARVVDDSAEHREIRSEARAAGERSARRADDLAAVLALAGWAHGATLARRVRDLHLSDDADAARSLAIRLDRQVRRSRLLRRSLQGLGAITTDDVDRLALPDAMVGDVHARVTGMTAGLAQPNAMPPDEPSTIAAALPSLVTGLDLAAARLQVASLGISRLQPRSVVPYG